MGHTRLGQLPFTRKWQDVVGLVAAGANVPQVANATLDAAESAFSYVSNDTGYNHAVWLITQLGLAGSHQTPLEYLRSQGVDIPDDTSLPGIAVALTEALDRHSAANGGHSDLGELAQRALVDAVVQRLEPKLEQRSLFNLQADHAQRALSMFRTEKEFGALAREFYSRLTNECLNYFLSRTLATHLGEGQRFATMNQMAQFEDALRLHSKEAAVIVEEYSSEWFSKHRHLENKDISATSVRGYASYALQKMKDELKARAKADGK